MLYTSDPTLSSLKAAVLEIKTGDSEDQLLYLERHISQRQNKRSGTASIFKITRLVYRHSKCLLTFMLRSLELVLVGWESLWRFMRTAYRVRSMNRPPQQDASLVP